MGRTAPGDRIEWADILMKVKKMWLNFTKGTGEGITWKSGRGSEW